MNQTASTLAPPNRFMTPDTIDANLLGDRLTAFSGRNACREDMPQDAALIHDSHRRRDKLRLDSKYAFYYIVNIQNNTSTGATGRAFP